jgi:hypothetical protein
MLTLRRAHRTASLGAEATKDATDAKPAGRLKWTVRSENVRTLLGPMAKHGTYRTAEISGMFREKGVLADERTLERALQGEVSRTHPIPGAAAVAFDETFDKQTPDHFIVRTAFISIDILRNMRADNARRDYIVAAIECAESFCKANRPSASGQGAAALDSLLAVAKFSRLHCKWHGRHQELPLLKEAKELLMRSIEASRAINHHISGRHVDLLLVPDYENLLFVASEIDEHESKRPFNANDNPHKTTREVLQQLKAWGAIEAMYQYAKENKCLRAAYNLAECHGLTGASSDAEAAFLLCFSIQPPEANGHLQLPETTQQPKDIPYLREAYEQALKTYREARAKGREKNKVRKTVKKLSLSEYAILAFAMTTGVSFILFATELLAKPLPG